MTGLLTEQVSGSSCSSDALNLLVVVAEIEAYLLAAKMHLFRRIFARPFSTEGEIMRSIFGAILSLALLGAGALAQQTPAPTPDTQRPRSDEQPSQPTESGQSAQSPASQAQRSNSLKIAPGSVIPVQVTKTVDAKKAKPGDEVVATVTQDMKTTKGDLLVPKDTKVIGHITEAQARNKEQKQSELAITFDRAVVKGDQMQLPMSIQAVIAPPSHSNNESASAPEQGPAPAGGGLGAPGSPMGSGGRSGGSGTPSAPSTAPQSNYPQGGGASEANTPPNARPEINGNTQGVIGMSDVKLEAASQNSHQGSVLTSEKNNVKIEKGTMLLLRVNQ